MASELHEVAAAHTRRFANSPGCPEIPPGVNWKLLAYIDHKPYIVAKCGTCKYSMDTESVNGVFVHCGKRETAPKHIVEEFEYRAELLKPKKQSLLQRVLNPAPVPNL